MAARSVSPAPAPEAPSIEIDGIGAVPVPRGFFDMPRDQQNEIVDALATQRHAPPPTGVAAAQGGSQTTPDPSAPAETAPIAERGTILPVGVTETGNLQAALPEFLETPRKAVMDLLSGKRQAKDLTGEEIFAMGALFGPMSAAAGTTRGIARAAAPREATPAETAAPAAAMGGAAEAVPAAAGPIAASPAPAATAARGGLHSTPESMAARSEAKAAFRPLDESNVVVSPESFRAVATELTQQAAKTGLDETITPAANALVKRLNAATTEPVTLQSLNTLREVASAAAGSRVPRDRAIAENVVNRLDDFFMNLSARDLVVGEEANVKAIAQSVKEARKAWSEAMKLETVARLVQRAQDSVANRPSLGIENSLRTEFTNLMKNDREMRRFSAAEKEAIRRINRGATKATMRSIGRLAPTGPVSGLAAGGLAVGLGAKMGLDPMAAMLVIGAPAFGARKLAAVLTQRSVSNLENLIRAGSGGVGEGTLARGRTLAEQLAASMATASTAEAAAPRQ